MSNISLSGRLAALSGVLALQACTTQMVATPISDFKTQVAGQVYYLPKTEFQITIARELKACATGFPSDSGAAPRWLHDQLKLINLLLAEKKNKDAAMLLAVALNDPVLEQADVRETVKALLGNTSLSQILDAQDNAKPPKPLQSVSATQDQIGTAVKALAQASPVLPATFDVEVSAQAVPLVLADTQQFYAIDFNDLQNDLKGTDYSVESYPNGTLKSINVTIDDQTSTVVQGVLSGAAKLAAGLGGFPFPSTQSGDEKRKIVPFKEWKQAVAESRPICNADVRLKLLQRGALATKVESDAEAALAMQKKVAKLGEAEFEAQAARDKLAAQVKDLPDDDASKPKLQAMLKLAEATLKKASSALAWGRETQREENEAAAKTAARLSALRKVLTVTTMTTVSPQPAAQNYSLSGADEAKLAWLDKRVKASCSPLDDDDDCYVIPTVVDKGLAASAALYPVTAGGGPARQSDKEQGVWYRQPLRSYLYVCAKGDCLTAGTMTAPPSRVVLASPVDVPQFGPMAFLLLRNKAFQNNTIAASFAENGALTKLTYKSNAAAAKAAEVFESSADTIMKFKEAKQNQGATKATAEAAELDARKKLVEAQLALEKAQSDLNKFRDEQKTGQ
ncbi:MULTISPECIES: hypothetical protein [Delftia]|uniref:hypothetical protein n=1 Tax=Delftia TaxID=80865 RepID=UPI000773DD46|nr:MULTISPECIES: hypothetical protein [Delftia]MPT49447.1 hypothetical protein [Delftia sp.]SFB26228.1 hypothetical protein SAMN05444579_103401 [Delftia tsuruhatensis]